MRVMKIHSPEEFAKESNMRKEEARQFQLDRLYDAAFFENKIAKIGDICWYFKPDVGAHFWLEARVPHLHLHISAFPTGNYFGYTKNIPKEAHDERFLVCDLIRFSPDYSGENSDGSLNSVNHICYGKNAIDDAARLFRHLSKPKNVDDKDSYEFEI